MADARTGTTYVPAMAAANAVLELGSHEGIPVTPIELQRLLYLVYCGYEKADGTRLFTEPFRVWQYGPVVESVYWKFRCSRVDPVTCFASDAKVVVEGLDTERSPALRHVMADIWQLYLGMSPVEPCGLVRTGGTAWDYAWRNRLSVLPDDRIALGPCFQS